MQLMNQTIGLAFGEWTHGKDRAYKVNNLNLNGLLEVNSD
jgi:hypothetical protein